MRPESGRPAAEDEHPTVAFNRQLDIAELLNSPLLIIAGSLIEASLQNDRINESR
jgi:hypothetical protein